MGEYQRDDDGNVIDPPVIPAHERAISDAAAAGDERALARAQRKYDAERDDIVAEIDGADDDPNAAGDGDNARDGYHPDDNASGVTDPDALARDNSYDDLRRFAAARDLSQSGDKSALSKRLAEHEESKGEST